MKKSNRFLAVLLTLAMVFSMLPAGALAADPSSPLPKVEETAPTETPKAETPTETPAAPETPKAETPTETPAAPVSLQSAGARVGKAAIPATVSSNATWDGNNQEVATAVTVSGDSTVITVTGEVTVKAPITVSGGTVTFSGGGKLIRDASFKGKMLDITDGTVTLTSITLDGNNVTAVTNPLVSVAASAVLTLNTGATMQNNKTTGDYTTSLGGAISTAGTVTMNTGAVIKDSSAYYGGGVFVGGAGIFNMAGGKISGCIATTGGSGGAICIQPKSDTTGAVNISGGEITGNTAAVYGGAIHGGKQAGTIAITGTANIHNNVSTNGYAIYPLSSTVTVGGAAKITGNTNGAGAPSNLYAASSKTFAIDPDLSAGANIGVTGNVGDITDATAASTDATYVHADDPQMKVVFDTDKLELAANPNAYVSAGGSDTNGNGSFAKPYATIGKAYTALTNGGEIRLLSDLTAAAATIFDTASKNVTLTSCKADGTAWAAAGDTRTVKRGAGFTSDSVLKVSNGTVTLDHITLDGNKGAVDATAPLVSVGTGTSLTLGAGATIQNNKNTTTSGLGGGVNVAGTLTMSSGSTITGNSLAGDGNTYGGGVYVASGAVFHMNGGTISNNTVTAGGGSGGGIMVAPAATNATVTITGGEITGNSCGANGAAIHGGAAGSTIAISGTATITGNQITGATFVGGAVYPHFSTLTLSGPVKITGNTNKAGTPSNLYLKDATTLKLSGALTGDASIGVYMQTPPTVAGTMKPVAVSDTTYAVQATDATHVHSDNGGVAIVQYKDVGSADASTDDTLELKVLAPDVWVRSDEDTDTAHAAVGNDSTGEGTKAKPYEGLGKAYLEVANNGTIHVMNDLTTGATAFAVNKTVNIVSSNWDTDAWKDSGTVHSIQSALANDATDYLLNITAGAVNLKNIIVDGGAKWTGDADTTLKRGITNDTGIHTMAAMIHVGSGAALTLNAGVEVRNHDNQVAHDNGDKGGAIFVQGGTLTMNDTAKIVNNAVSKSTIGDGGAVALWLSSTFTMNGGEISGNYAHRSGGGVRVDGSIMNLNGGTIKNNKSAGTGDAPGGAAIYCDNGHGVLNIAPLAAISITNNESPKAGGGIWTNSPLNILKNGSATISITGNKTGGAESNIYLSGGVVINDQHDDTNATIGISTAATPTPGHPVKITNGTADNVKDDFASDDLRKGGISYKNGSIYLDAAEKAVAQITNDAGTTVHALYKTFDEAMAAIKNDSGNLLHNDAEGKYTVELLADCTTTTGLPNVNLTIQSDNAGATKYTLTSSTYLATAKSKTTALTNMKLVGTSSQDGLLHAWGNVDINGCTLQAWSPDTNVLNVAGTTTIADSNITGVILHNSSTHSLTINTGDVALNGKFLLDNAAATIKLAAGSTAANRYNVEYGNTIALATDGTKVIMDGTALADDAAAAAIAKLVTVSGGNDPTKEWVAVGSSKNIVLKPAKAFYVSKNGNDSSGAGTYVLPYKTIAKAYGEAGIETGLDIRVLSDLSDTAATTLSNATVSFVKISSYQNEQTPATAPWTITRKDAAGALLAITKGNVTLTNITLDGKGDTLASDTALVTVAAGTALTLDDKATIQNNKNTTTSGLGGGVNVAGTLTMNSGSTITGNTLTGGGSTYGSGVYVANGATFQMNGGTISNNTVNSDGGSGGGIMVAPAATTATVRIGGDALITGNSCGANGAAIHGGGVDSTITISGNAKITGNRITAPTGYVGAAVYPNGGSLVLSGDVQITGNSNQNGNACNVYLGDTKTLTIAGAHMGAGSAVGVYCETMPSASLATVDIATNAIDADKGHFFSDKSSEAGIKFDGDKVVLAYDARYIPEPVYPEPDRPDPNVTVEPGPGKVTTRPKNPDPGTKVTVTIEPETGWEVDKVIIVTVPGGKPVVVTGTDPITYIAPDPNTVKITVKYKRIPVDPRKNGVSKLLEADKHIAYFVGDGSGKFNPEKGITRAETAQIFYNLLKNKNVEQTVSFQDVEAKAWYAQAVNTLASLKIIEGRGHNYFDPMAYISRAEFTAIAMRFADSIKGTFTYTDVPADYWAESAISGAAQYGWIMGYADGSFKPMENIKRAEAAKIVNTMLWRFPDTKFIDKAEGLKTFPDLAKGNWAYYDVVEATNAHEFAQTKTGAETWKK